jgi:hypothetical protein
MDARAPRLRFGDFELDPGSATLLRGSRRVRIQPQPLRVLAILVDRAGEVVSREELRDAVWDQATFVEFDQGLNYCIRQIIAGRTVLDYDVSADGSQVVFSAPSQEGIPQLWLGWLDGRSVPRLLGAMRGDEPFFGPDRDVLFRQSDGVNNYLLDVKLDGSMPVKAMRDPILHFKGMSPDGRWAVVQVPVDEVPTTAVVAVSLTDGAVKRICPAECMVRWSPDGLRFYVEPFLQGQEGGKAIAIPVPKESTVPDMPASGLRSAADSVNLRGSAVVDLATYAPAHDGGSIAPGQAPDTFAYAKTTSHRNLFQIQLP